MNRLRRIVFGSLVAGSLLLSAGPTLARVDWRDIQNGREKLLTDYDELARNRRQLEWDLDHGASSYQIERDRRAVENTLEDVRRDRELLRRDMRDFSEDLS
jgi:chromosome segregation ATPase